MDDQLSVPARGAFTSKIAMLPRAASGSRLRITEPPALGLATLMARKDRTALASRIMDQYDIELSSGPTLSARRSIAFVGIGPGTWLACREGADHTWASELAKTVSGLASVSDQSSGYAVLRIAGSDARNLLSRGVFIDIHPSVFGPGSAAVAAIAHIGVIMWQLDLTPTYNIALFRSFSGSFWHWIESTCRIIGVEPAAGISLSE